MTTDFRKADPQYTDFVPRTAGDAIDLFFRFKRRGLMPEHHPETFVWVSRELDDKEGEKFEQWLCAPQGVREVTYKGPNKAIEAERLQLLKEAEARDAADARRHLPDDEKTEPEDFEMVTQSCR